MASFERTALTPYGHVLWRRGRSWMAPAIGWGALFLAGAFASLVPIGDVWARALAGGAGLALSFIAAGIFFLIHSGDEYTKLIRWYLSASVLTGGVWLTAALVTSALTLTSRWGFAASALGLVWFVLAFSGTAGWHKVKLGQTTHEYIALERREKLRQQEREKPLEPPPPPLPPPPTPQQAEANEWNQIFERAGLKGLMFLRREVTVDNNFALHVEFAEGSRMNFAQLSNNLEDLEMALDRVFRSPQGLQSGNVSRMAEGLRTGSIRAQRAVNFKGQTVPTQAVIYVDLEDILARVVRMPRETGPLSVYNAFSVGFLETGQPLMMTPADIHRMIVGQTRYGKSNFLLGVIIWRLSQCTDALIWTVDLKGGRGIRSWLEPYLLGQINPDTGKPLERPIIDWAGTNRFVAERIYLSAIEAAKVRPGLAKGTKWIASPERPAIFVLSDEIAEGTGQYADPAWGDASQGLGSAEMAALVTRGHMLGAGEGVYFITAGQRATVTMMVNGDAKSQMGGRYGFKMSDTGDSGDIFQGNGRTEAARMHANLTHKGSLVVQDDDNPDAVRAKSYFMGDGEEYESRVREGVFALTKWRPDLDSGTAAAIEKFGYSRRFDRDQLGWFFGETYPMYRWNQKPGEEELDIAAAAEALGVRDGAETPFGSDGLTDEEREKEAREDAAFLRAKESFQGPAANVDPYTRFCQIVEEAGHGGITPSAALAQMLGEGCAPAARTTIYSFRDRAEKAGLLVQPMKSRNGAMFSSQFANR